MAGMSNTLVDKTLNASTPTGASGAPGTWTAYAAGAMKLRLNSASSTASAAGTELTGTGYTTGGQAFSEAATAASGGSAVTIPETTALSWTNGSGGSWSIQSWDLTDSAGARSWFDDFNGAPISVANGNTFEVQAGQISIDVA